MYQFTNHGHHINYNHKIPWLDQSTNVSHNLCHCHKINPTKEIQPPHIATTKLPFPTIKPQWRKPTSPNLYQCEESHMEREREREREVYLFSPTVFIVVGFIFDILKSQTLKNYEFLRLKVLPSEQPINIYNS